jgi:hypothetical protein
MEITALLFLLAILWFWFNSMHALEIARSRGQKVCKEANLQFLDDTVENTKTRLVRNEAGTRVFQRTYRFEFTETGNCRREGQLILTGDKVEQLTMEPYEMMVSQVG